MQALLAEEEGEAQKAAAKKAKKRRAMQARKGGSASKRWASPPPPPVSFVCNVRQRTKRQPGRACRQAAESAAQQQPGSPPAERPEPVEPAGAEPAALQADAAAREQPAEEAGAAQKAVTSRRRNLGSRAHKHRARQAEEAGSANQWSARGCAGSRQT